MSTPNFRFRQFEVYHDRCAMKVGTDAVLLGAWCPLPSPPLLDSSVAPSGGNLTEGAAVLDIGTGSGVIALMLAQRLHSQREALIGRQPSQREAIHAIDIDPEAVEQASENFARSPWADSLSAEYISLQDFVKKQVNKPLGTTSGSAAQQAEGTTSPQGFSLIVSNPPYFRDSLRNPDPQRREARHADSLTYEELIAGAATLLVDNGLLGLVLPAEAEDMIMSLAAEYGLYAEQILYVRTTPDKAPKRILIAFRKSTSSLPLRGKGTGKGSLTLSDSTHPRTPEYAALTRDFYL